MTAPAPGFRSLEIGQVIQGRLTVTEAHIVMASGIFADFAPLHTDEVFARKTRFGTRIAHGTLVLGIMTGVLGKTLGTNASGMLDQQVRYVAPVVAGDTVRSSWTVAEKTEKPEIEGGIVRFSGVCENQDGTVVVEGETTLIVAYGDGADECDLAAQTPGSFRATELKGSQERGNSDPREAIRGGGTPPQPTRSPEQHHPRTAR